ncbi:MAG: sulfatase [Candidatus Eisenbacteria bacterium]
MVLQRRLGLFVFVALLFCCGPVSGPLNVVLIGIDTLRADHLGCYGYSRDTSPNIDRLASEGVRFETAISASPWTLPSFATVFTSLYPSQHGVGSFLASMRTTFPTLAMMLLKLHYSTAAFVSSAALSADFKIDRGFEYYYAPSFSAERQADAITRDALKIIDRPLGKPFFLFVHYFDPHLPYSPPPPYAAKFNPGYQGPFSKSFTPEMIGTNRDRRFDAVKALSPTDLEQIVSLYDGEIGFTDEAVGRLLAGLEERSLRRNTLILLLSDHGEEFLDHGGFEHGHSLFSELIKVPLIISLPGRLPKNKIVQRQVRLLDVTPTVLDLLGVLPDAHLEGVSLKPLIVGKGNPRASDMALLPPDAAYSGALLSGPEKKSMRVYPWKLIYEIPSGATKLYNLEDDPGEKQDEAAQETEVRELLEEILFKTVFGVSDTWYLEMAVGGQDRTVDLKISLKKPSVNSKIYLYDLLDDQGHIVDADQVIENVASGSALKIEGLRLNRTMTLAFKVEPKSSPIEFDLKMDGQRMSSGTFVGQQLIQQRGMPFTQKGPPAGRETEGEPSERPAPPYFMVWRSGGMSLGETPARLTEDTKKQLRTLGYLQ